MNNNKNKHIGSGFDDFLQEEGILEEAEAIASKRFFVFQVKQELKKQKLKKTELAKRMHTSRSSVDRILNPKQPSTVESLSKVAIALGKHLEIQLV